MSTMTATYPFIPNGYARMTAHDGPFLTYSKSCISHDGPFLKSVMTAITEQVKNFRNGLLRVGLEPVTEMAVPDGTPERPQTVGAVGHDGLRISTLREGGVP